MTKLLSLYRGYYSYKPSCCFAVRETLFDYSNTAFSIYLCYLRRFHNYPN